MAAILEDRADVAPGQRPPWRYPPMWLAAGLTVGLAAGLTVGFVFGLIEFLLLGRMIREVRLFDYGVLYPALGLAAAIHAGHVVRDRANGVAPVPIDPTPESRNQRDRRRMRFLATGFGVGVLLGIASTLGDLAWRGLRILPFQLFYNLLFFPVMAASIGLNFSRLPGEPTWLWPRIRFRMKTMMILVAYLAIVFGLGKETSTIGMNAKKYHHNYANAALMVKVYGGIATKSRLEAPTKLRNAEVLRKGEVPGTLDPRVICFLESLDSTATPEEKTARFENIALSEERTGRMAESNLATYSKLTDYHAKLAAKYARAENQPWLPVEPDPPPP